MPKHQDCGWQVGSPGINLLGSPTSGNQLQGESPTELLPQANQSNLWVVVVVEGPLLFWAPYLLSSGFEFRAY